MSTVESRSGTGTPASIVTEAAGYLQPHSRVVDLGAGRGRNAIYLAGLGHEVSALEIDRQEVWRGRSTARNLGDIALRLTFLEGDIQEPKFDSQFDAAISIVALQELGDNKESVYNALNKMTGLTRPAGINVLSVYVGTDKIKAIKSPKYYIFSPGELGDYYRHEGWEVIEHPADYHALDQLHGSKKLVVTRDDIIAFNPQSLRQREHFVKLADYYRHDPELRDYYLEQANTLSS